MPGWTSTLFANPTTLVREYRGVNAGDKIGKELTINQELCCESIGFGFLLGFF